MNKQEVIRIIQHEQFQVPYGPGIFVHAVFSDKAIELINQIHEPQKVVVPKFVAEWIEDMKNAKTDFFEAQSNCMSDEVDDWYYNHADDLLRAWLDGYEIEQEKLYTVELFNGQPLVEVNNILHFSSDLAASNAHVSKDKLEKAGFGWVFDCSGVKVVEAE